jgi:hypothetical protein
MTTRLLTVREAAQALRLSPGSLASRAFRARHRIPSVRLGRRLVFDARTLDEFIAANREIGAERQAAAAETS